MRFHDPQYAIDYDRRLSSEGYPGILLQETIPFLRGSSILEIGAGSGLFSIPLLEYGYEVIALEPSFPMINLLKQKIKPSYSCSLQHEYWEESTISHAENIISVHSLYPMKNIKDAVLKMIDLSENVIIIIRRDQGNETLSDALRQSLNIQKKYSRFNHDLSEILHKNNIDYRVHHITEKRLLTIHNIDQEAYYYSQHLDYKDIPFLKKQIAALTHYNVLRNVYEFNGVYYDNIYHITHTK